MRVLEGLQASGLVHDVTDREKLGALLDERPLVFYCGFDPSAKSLHVGNLVPMSLVRHLQHAGHKAIALIGGATGMIGDPSGKSEERRLLDRAALAENVASVGAQIERLLPGAVVVNNADWIGPLSLIDFLRDVGKHITVNYMLAKETVRTRLEDRGHGISYTEFSYMLLQAYDFAHLARTQQCLLQVGGSDQWGNITAGIELTRRMGGPEVFGLVGPLLMAPSGKKFGKTEEGTSVWLDPNLTSPYRFYQYWINSDDADVASFLRMFTMLPLSESAELIAKHQADPGKRLAQRRLAEEMTTWVHGADASRRAAAASQVAFGGSLADLRDADLEPLLQDVPSSEILSSELAAGVAMVDLLPRVGLADSKGAARRLLAQGGAYVNNVRVEDPGRVITNDDRATESIIVLRAGKKSYHFLRAR
ncbi:MAG: tyrosine--tRNA ligase [Pseudomonadota bacterium]